MPPQCCWLLTYTPLSRESSKASFLRKLNAGRLVLAFCRNLLQFNHICAEHHISQNDFHRGDHPQLCSCWERWVRLEIWFNAKWPILLAVVSGLKWSMTRGKSFKAVAQTVMSISCIQGNENDGQAPSKYGPLFKLIRLLSDLLDPCWVADQKKIEAWLRNPEEVSIFFTCSEQCSMSLEAERGPQTTCWSHIRHIQCNGRARMPSRCCYVGRKWWFTD